jgi:hypothetical protein
MAPRNSLSKRVLRQARWRARIPTGLDIAGVRCQDDDLRFAKFAKNRSCRRISRSINVGVVLYFGSQFRTVRRSQVLISV